MEGSRPRSWLPTAQPTDGMDSPGHNRSDWPAHEVLWLWRDQVRDHLHSRGFNEVRVAGLAAVNRSIPGVPIELYVGDLPSPDWAASDMARIDRELTDLLGLAVVVGVVPVGQECIAPGEAVKYL